MSGNTFTWAYSQRDIYHFLCCDFQQSPGQARSKVTRKIIFFFQDWGGRGLINNKSSIIVFIPQNIHWFQSVLSQPKDRQIVLIKRRRIKMSIRNYRLYKPYVLESFFIEKYLFLAVHIFSPRPLYIESLRVKASSGPNRPLMNSTAKDKHPIYLLFIKH